MSAAASPVVPTEGEIYLVIGGEGFLGRAIVTALVEQRQRTGSNDEIRVLDLRQVHDDANVVFFQGDICNARDMDAALTHEARTATVVFHTASPVMKAPEALHTRVNIEGTKCVLERSRVAGVAKFVYTSSASVVYAGKPLENVDESIAYPESFADYYSETKAIAEKIVLAHNDVHGMRTAAIRPSGIFGPGDRQMTPGALGAQRRNLPVLIQIGENTAPFDFTYVSNIADAHLLCADKMYNDNVHGQAFFITNDEPKPMWSFFRMIWAEAGDTRGPMLVIPTVVASVILVLLKFLAAIHLLKHDVPFVFGMIFTPRYFNISKAKKYLGYSPRVSHSEGVPIAVKACLEQWAKDEEAAAKSN